MPKTLTVYSYIPRNYSASYYYRIQVPFDTASRLGIPVRAHIDTNDSGIDPEHRMRVFCEADIIMLYQPVGAETVANVRTAKSFMPSKRDGDWKWPPTLVIDTDDNLFNVNPYNVAYRGLGIRDHEGRDIPAGHMIGVMQNGEKKVLWKDGENGFDITRNRQTVDTYRTLVNMSDAVTCTTSRVADAVRADASPRRVQVFPNCVRFDHYEQIDLVQDPSRVNILWQGGASHYEDWFPLKAALGEVTKKYPQIHWIVWGQLYQWLTDVIPADRYTFVDWCNYPEYKLRLVMMNHQINLAPLNDNRFNRCRSAIKFYEGSVLRRPAATLAQRTGPYADEIIDGETGLLFDDPKGFVEQLSRLVEDEGLRRTVAANAKDWVSENRDAFKVVPKHMAFLEELREQVKVEQPHMPDEEWEEFERRVAESEKTQEPAPAGG